MYMYKHQPNNYKVYNHVLANYFCLPQAMIASNELGVYDCLVGSPKTPSEIASAIQVPDVHVGELCDLLVTMGLLDKEKSGKN